MKKFDLVLQGGVKITINEEEKKIMEGAMLGGEKLLTVGNNQFRSSMIKGIFEIKDEVKDNSEVWKKENREWHEECLRQARKSVLDKTDDEINTRILPGLRLGKIELPEDVVEVMRVNIMEYFKQVNSPRCPMKIWWPFIAEHVAPENIIRNEEGKVVSRKRPNPNMFMGKWWQYVARNDDAISQWMMYSGGLV